MTKYFCYNFFAELCIYLYQMYSVMFKLIQGNSMFHMVTSQWGHVPFAPSGETQEWYQMIRQRLEREAGKLPGWSIYCLILFVLLTSACFISDLIEGSTDNECLLL